MTKELFISSSPHETKVAVWEDGELVEVYYQRDTDRGLVGSIYKGRVSRVLPGMQSAFVDIGLGRDAFLYVSDFFEDSEEYDKVLTEAEARVSKFTEEASAPEAPPAGEAAPAAALPSEAAGTPTPPAPAGPAPAAAPAPSLPPESHAYNRHEHRGRRRRRRPGRGFADSRFAPRRDAHDRPREYSGPGPTTPTFEVLPGESLARYSKAAGEAGEPAAPATAADSGGTAPLPSQAAGEPSEAMTPSSPPAEAASAAAVETQAESMARVPAERSPAPSLRPPSAIEEAAEGELQGQPPELSEDSARGSEEEAGFEDEETPLGAGPETPEETGPEALAEPAAAPREEAEGAAAETPADYPASETEAGPAGTPAEPGDRTYTVREPDQRPRFAPRRARRGRGGRFGRTRPEGGRRWEPLRPGNDQPVQINELLKEGQEILVQIAKEPLGTKGARITSHIALPGRFLVYMPTISHIGVSRKIASEEERLRLRNIILENRGSLTGGIIVRTAAAGRSEEDLKADLRFLSTLWNEIRARAERSKAPALIHGDLTLVERVLRDILSPDFKTIWVDSEIEYEHTLDFVNRFQPSLVGQVKLYTRDTPMFEEFGIQQEIDKALRPKVWLKSGGYIVINQTEALVAIDVNTGKFVGKTNRLEDTIVKTNIDAVKEIVRQIRLRDLGGIIVIDFIDMDDRRNRFKVVQALEEALRADRAPTKILSINEFGLVALTRKRVKQSLERTLSEPCPYCGGAGWVKSVTTVCCEIFSEVRKMARQIEGNILNLRVNPEVAKALKSREGVMISELETLTGKNVVIRSDPLVHQERFEIF
jgi:ribonuclease G